MFEYVPVAMNCFVIPSAMLGFVGVIAMDTRVALVTLNSVAPETLPNVAVIVLLPAATAVAVPRKPKVLLTIATPELEELQVTEEVISCIVLLEYVPIAAKEVDVPSAIFGLIGVTERDTNVALVVVNCAEPTTLPNVAVIVALPAATEVANPRKAATLLTVTTPALDEFQTTDSVMSCVVPSE